MVSAAAALTLVLLGATALTAAQQVYRAAVLEHAVIFADTYEETYAANLRAYKGNATVAASKDADIIVFPEYGIGQMGIRETREELVTLAQAVPDPEEVSWTPCDEPSPRLPNIKVLVALSCMARMNDIAIVANMVSRVECNSTTDEECPEDDQYLYNTNVIFAKNGTLVGRYRKHYLFREPNLNPGPRDGFTIVDLGFVKLGTIVCFDIMHYDPLVEYVKEHGIKNIAFPTNWVDTPPLVLSVQTFASIAHGLGINLLAADLHLPMRCSMGSGIYSGTQGALVEVYDLSSPSKLLISEVPVDPPVLPELPTESCPSWVKGHVCEDFDPESANWFGHDTSYLVAEPIPASEATEESHNFWFTPIDSTAFVYLEEMTANTTLCQDGVCCLAQYEFANKDEDAYYALSGFSGYLSKEFPMYVQTCTVIRCESRNVSTCGAISAAETTTRFKVLELSGNFNTDYLYPNVLSTGLQNIKPGQWKFSEAKSCPNKRCERTTGTISVSEFSDEPLYVARIMGRMYDRDLSNNTVSHNSGPGQCVSTLLPAVVGGLLFTILLSRF